MPSFAIYGNERMRGPGPAVAGAAYAGPGDIVAGALAWFGLRGYNLAYCTGSNPAVDVVDTATGLLTTTVNIKTDGTLDTATILGLGYAVSVKKLYDQTGNGHHLSMTTLADMPALILNVTNGRPIIRETFVAGESVLTDSTTTIQAQPFTISFVAKRSSGASFSGVLSTAAPLFAGFSSTADNVTIFAGTVLNAPATDGVFHAVQGIFNGASSNANVDGADNVGDAGAGVYNNDTLTVPRTTTDYDGDIAEAGLWGAAFTGTQNTNMRANQAAYYGI